MSDHRRLQRTLFRMQADATFAGAVLAGDGRAVASTGLAEGDLALLRACDPAGISADPDGKRRLQILGNAASEFLATLSAAERSAPDLLDTFPAAREFHTAMAEDGRLPLAFAAFARRRAQELADTAFEAVAALEEAMARLRRRVLVRSIPIPHPRSNPSPHPPGDPPERAAVAVPATVVLAPGAHLHVAPGGTLAWAEELRVAREARRDPPAPPADFGAERETLLLRAVDPRAHRLAEVRAERLEPPADELLTRARAGLTIAERAGFARDHGAEPQDLEAFLASFVREGVLISRT